MINVKTMRDSRGRLLTAKVVDSAPEHENRNDWKTMAAAEEVARVLNQFADGFDRYLATDAGPHVSPRYDVIALPKVGDAVSYSFNGDSYPCGHVISVSAGPNFRRIVAHEPRGGKHVGEVREHVFWRRRKTGSWIMDGTWSLVAGHVDKRNPSF